jgi:DNA-binding transcriptional regulator YdaS (Cro superfamily)
MENDAKNTTKDNIIADVVENLGISNQKLADILGVSRARVENWRYKAVAVPADMLTAIIRLLLDELHKRQLAPIAARYAELAAIKKRKG